MPQLPSLQQNKKDKMQSLIQLKQTCPYFWRAYTNGELRQSINILKSHQLTSIKLHELASMNYSPSIQGIVDRIQQENPMFWKALTTGQLIQAFSLLPKQKRRRNTISKQTASLHNTISPIEFQHTTPISFLPNWNESLSTVTPNTSTSTYNSLPPIKYEYQQL